MPIGLAGSFPFEEVSPYTQLRRPSSKSLAELDLKEEAFIVGWRVGLEKRRNVNCQTRVFGLWPIPFAQ